MSGNNSPHPGTTVTTKVLQILGAFTPQRPLLSLSEICDRTGLTTPTVYRLAAELLTWGALERSDSGSYRVGLRLWEIGSLAPQAQTLRQVAQPYMQDLFAATKENVQLAVREGNQALYVEKVFGRMAVPVVSRVGHRLPLHATGVGKVLLAFSSEIDQESVLRDGLTRYTPYTIVMPGRLRQALEETRQTGIATSIEEMSLGAVSVAAPIRDSSGRTVAALSLVGHSASLDARRTRSAVATAALGVSREVASRPLLAHGMPRPA